MDSEHVSRVVKLRTLSVGDVFRWCGFRFTVLLVLPTAVRVRGIESDGFLSPQELVIQEPA